MSLDLNNLNFAEPSVTMTTPETSPGISSRFWGYRPSYEIYIETPRYILKTANKSSELLNVFELRYQIFLDKSGQDGGFDIDQFDSICDHLIIIDKESEQVVGTYRIISSKFSEKFYSQQEFDLDHFINSPGDKLELGRVCIHQEHRNGLVIDLLWKGICRYIDLTKSRYLFGCSSIKTVDPETAKLLFHYLKNENLVQDHFGIDSTGQYLMDFSTEDEYTPEVLKEAKSYLPSLLRSYFSAGAFVHGRPALDLEFGCIDFLTILDINNISPSYKRRYMGASC